MQELLFPWSLGGGVHPPGMWMHPPTEKLPELPCLGLYGGSVMYLRLTKSCDHWPLVINSISGPSPFLRVREGGDRNSNPLIMQLVALVTSPHPEDI